MGGGLKLVGQGIVLREMAAEDAELVVTWRNDPSVAAQMFGSPPASIGQHLEWFEQMKRGGRRREFVIARVQLSGEQPVGTIGLSEIDDVHRRAEYGIAIGEPSARGQGVAREASKLILDFAFQVLGLDRVFLHVFASNTNAIRLYERLGFVREGTLRRHVWKDQLPRDVLVMGLLKSEWSDAIMRLTAQ